jgi:hypothetical protein
MHQILSNCRELITPEDEQEIVKKMPKLIKKMATKGFLLDDKDFKGIKCAGNRPSRDNTNALHRKGFTFLTDPNLIRRPVMPIVEVVDPQVEEQLVEGATEDVDLVEPTAPVGSTTSLVLELKMSRK